MRSFIQILRENKDRFIDKNSNLDPIEKQNIKEFFKTHPSYESKLNWNKSDTFTYKTFEDIMKSSEESSTQIKKKSKSDLKLYLPEEHFTILQDSGDKVYAYVKDWEGAKIADSFNCNGQGAKWCIGYEKTDEYFEHYTNNGFIFILELLKKPINDNKKLMIQFKKYSEKNFIKLWVPEDHTEPLKDYENGSEFISNLLEKNRNILPSEVFKINEKRLFNLNEELNQYGYLDLDGSINYERIDIHSLENRLLCEFSHMSNDDDEDEEYKAGDRYFDNIYDAVDFIKNPEFRVNLNPSDIRKVGSKKQREDSLLKLIETFDRLIKDNKINIITCIDNKIEIIDQFDSKFIGIRVDADYDTFYFVKDYGRDPHRSIYLELKNIELKELEEIFYRVHFDFSKYDIIKRIDRKISFIKKSEISYYILDDNINHITYDNHSPLYIFNSKIKYIKMENDNSVLNLFGNNSTIENVYGIPKIHSNSIKVLNSN